MSTKKTNNSKIIQKIRKERLTFGKMIESIRKADNITQVELAAKLKISRAHLCDLEKGRRTITVARAIQLSNILGYSTHQFVAKALEDITCAAGLDVRITLEAA